MKTLSLLTTAFVALGLTFGAAAADGGQSKEPNLPPKTLTKDNLVKAPDNTAMMSQQEQCQWNCYNASLSCIRAGGDDCNTPYQQCVSYCG